MQVLAISGSLRAASSNTAALEALATVAPQDIEVVLFDGLRAIPPFDPDEDGPEPPAPVAALRRALTEADALVISSPEYARGVAGALKNALDWLVSGPEMPGKPVALINTSPRALHGQAALRLTLETMSVRLIDEACATLPLLGRGADADAIAADASMTGRLRTVLNVLAEAAGSRPQEG